MKILLYSLLSLLGSIALFLGIIFIVASHGIDKRIFTGFILLSISIFLLIIGIRGFKSNISLTPQKIREKLLKLARKYNGTINENLIIAELGSDKNIKLEIEKLIEFKIIKIINKNGKKNYSFPDLHLSLIFKKCPYCGNDYPVRDNIINCPGCGGDLKIIKAKINSEDNFSLD